MRKNKPYLESKYHISSADKYLFLQDFKKFIIPDENGDSSGYFVSTTYFDTENLDFYLDKQEGEFFKVKIRLRRYSCDKKHWTAAKIELKMKVAEATIKLSEWISKDDFYRLISFPVSGYEILKLLNWNKRSPIELIAHKTFKPVVNVIYSRQAFFFPVFPDLRLTFDHNICASKTFLSPKSFILSEIQNIFEIKSNIKIPLLLSEWLKNKNITQEHFSKYSMLLKKML